jgi:hypothetical protein
MACTPQPDRAQTSSAEYQAHAYGCTGSCLACSIFRNTTKAEANIAASSLASNFQHTKNSEPPSNVHALETHVRQRHAATERSCSRMRIHPWTRIFRCKFFTDFCLQLLWWCSYWSHATARHDQYACPLTLTCHVPLEPPKQSSTSRPGSRIRVSRSL